MVTSVALIFVAVFACMIVGSLYSFHWAAKTGQLEQLRSAAETIFDHDERLGVVTDVFPDRKGLPKKGVTVVQSLKRNPL